MDDRKNLGVMGVLDAADLTTDGSLRGPKTPKQIRTKYGRIGRFINSEVDRERVEYKRRTIASAIASRLPLVRNVWPDTKIDVSMRGNVYQNRLRGKAALTVAGGLILASKLGHGIDLPFFDVPGMQAWGSANTNTASQYIDAGTGVQLEAPNNDAGASEAPASDPANTGTGMIELAGGAITCPEDGVSTAKFNAGKYGTSYLKLAQAKTGEQWTQLDSAVVEDFLHDPQVAKLNGGHAIPDQSKNGATYPVFNDCIGAGL